MNDKAFLLKSTVGSVDLTVMGLFLIDGSLETGKLTGRGIFTSDSSKRHINLCYAGGMPEPFELSFSGGPRYRGTFIVEDVRDAGVVHGEHRYDVDLKLVGIAQASTS